MKTRLLFIAVALIAFSCKQDNKEKQFQITANLVNIPDSTLVYISKDNKKIDSAFVLNGKVTFSGKVDQPTKVYLMVAASRDYKALWIENSEITFEAEKGKFREAKITGSETQTTNEILSNKIDPLFKEMMRIDRSYNPKMKQEQKDSLIAELEKVEQEMTKVNQDFVKENASSIVSANTLNIYASTWGKETTSELYNNFSPEIQNSSYGQSIKKYLDLNNEPQIGDRYVDFEMENEKGELKKLSAFEGKVVLLEFWASWCGPCREENPNLVNTYKNFNAKGFEIFAVSLDNNKKRWLEAIEKDQLTWDHVSDLQGDQNRAGLIYGVAGIPDNFLIDSQGKVIARNIRGNELDQKLAEILN